MISRKDRKIQYSEYGKQATEQILRADTARDEAMTRLRKIRNKRQKSQQHQLGRLTEKYGKEDPRVDRQAKRIANEAEMEKYLSVSIKKANQDVSIVDDGFVLKGRVFADNTKELAGHTVQLLDIKNNPIGKPAKTDKEGAYSIIIDMGSSESVARASIVVFNQKNIQLHKERLPVIIKANTVDSRDIIIKKSEQVIGRNDTIIQKPRPRAYGAAKKEAVAKRKVVTKKQAAATNTKAGKKVAKKVTKKAVKKVAKKKAKRVLKKVTRKKKTSGRSKK